ARCSSTTMCSPTFTLCPFSLSHHHQNPLSAQEHDAAAPPCAHKHSPHACSALSLPIRTLSVLKSMMQQHVETLSVLKTYMQQQHHVFSNVDDLRIPLSKREVARVEAAATEYHLFDIVGQSFFVVTPCHSAAFPGMVFNGTEILIREVSSQFSLELSIRTMRHADRVDQFDRELRAAWENLCGLMVDGGGGGRTVDDAILRIVYFWYQALPLSRGTAMVGYATLQGLFLAAGKEITASIPPRMQ
ncbi:unnamed protein product, partial [Closterium sp. NIES-64]